MHNQLCEFNTTTTDNCQSHLILLTGNPGVGKSTVAKELARQTSGLHIDIDVIKQRFVPRSEIRHRIDPPHYRYQYYKAAMQEVKKKLINESCETIIIDETFHLESYRKLWESYAANLKLSFYMIEIICPEQTVRTRILDAHNRNQHVLNKEESIYMYKKFKQVFEPVDNAICRIDTSHNIEWQVKQAIHSIKQSKTI